MHKFWSKFTPEFNVYGIQQNLLQCNVYNKELGHVFIQQYQYFDHIDGYIP